MAYLHNLIWHEKRVTSNVSSIQPCLYIQHTLSYNYTEKARLTFSVVGIVFMGINDGSDIKHRVPPTLYTTADMYVQHITKIKDTLEMFRIRMHQLH